MAIIEQLSWGVALNSLSFSCELYCLLVNMND
jgi:hypothetical protein